MITILPVTGLFDVKLLKDFGAADRLRKAYIAILTLPAISLLLLAMGKTQEALQTNNFVIVLAMLCILPLALSVRDQDKKPYGRLAVTVIRLGYGLISLVVLVPLLMYQNLISSKVPVLNVLFAHAVISTCVMFAILSIRGRQRDAMARDALLQYEIKARELERENARRLEKERFLSMLTHELRNPLTVIRLMTSPDSATGKAVQKAAIDMTKVIERVELSEKAGDARMDIRKVPLELGGFIGTLVRESAFSSRVDVDVEAHSRIETDGSILASVVQNLLDNAAKYSSSGSHIRISAAAEASAGGDGVTLTVTNDVDGADLPDTDKLFTKYYRAPGAHRKPGSGLGLFLVDGWVRALGGTITYEHERSAEGPASVSFRLWLPA